MDKEESSTFGVVNTVIRRNKILKHRKFLRKVLQLGESFYYINQGEIEMEDNVRNGLANERRENVKLSEVA